MAAALTARDAFRPLPARAAAPTPFVRRVVRSPENTYFTYPHANGFLPDGRAVIAHAGDPLAVEYSAFDLETGRTTPIASVPGARLYWAISANALMAAPLPHGVVIVDLARGGTRRVLDCPDWTVAADCDISGDGSKVLVTRSHYAAPEDFRTDIIDVATGAVQPVKEGWPMDHAHFSPWDPSWICFCDNRPAQDDRVWVWNAREAPQGRHLFNQIGPDGAALKIGHERAMFDRAALLVVAYGASPSRARGLYLVGFDGSVRLVSPGDRDLHCNVSRDGRWAVVSAQGTVVDDDSDDLVGLHRRATSDWLDTGPGYGYSDVMLVNLSTGARAFLYRGANDAHGQPYEVQPAISPDARWVLLKDARERRVLALEINQVTLASFLSP